MKFTIDSNNMRVSILRGQITYAKGRAARSRTGRWRLKLNDRRALAAGRYTLIYRARVRGRWITRREPVTIR